MVKSLRYFLAFLLLPAFQGLTAGTIGISIHDSTVVQGNKISFPVYVDSSLTGQNVTSFQLQINYSTYSFAPDTIVIAGTLSQSLGAVSYNAGVPGIITVAAAGSTPLSGTGILLYIRLKAVGTGYAYLSFTDAAHNFLNEGSPSLTGHSGTIYIQPAPTITIDPSSGSLTTGDSLQFYVFGGTAPYHWSLTNGSVATIDSSGLLKATHAGFTKVAASDMNGTVDTTNSSIEIRAFRLAVHDTSIMQGHTFNLPVYVTDLTGLNVTAGSFDLTFNQSLLTVQGVIQTGTLISSYSAPAVNTGLPGKVSISFAGTSPLSGTGVLAYVQFKVSSTVSGATAIAPVNSLFNETMPGNSKSGYFSAINLASLSINPYTANVVSGETLLFTASGGTPPYSWSTTDTSVATISSGGNLTPVKGGSVNVKAVDTYGGTGTSGLIEIFDTRVTIPDTSCIVGDTMEVPVYIAPLSPANPVSSIQAIISYDSSVVHFLSVLDAVTLTDGWTYVTNNSGNKVTLAGAGSSTFSASGVVCRLRFLVPSYVTSGRQTPLTMQQFLLNEGSPRSMLVSGGITALPVSLPAVPVLSSPASGSTNVSTSPTVSWNVSSGATTYGLQVSTDSTFSSISYSATGIVSTSVGLSGLLNLTKYFWRANASNSSGTSGWSTVWNFTTITAPPPAPSLATPANGATGVSIIPTLTWNSAAGATSYWLQLSTDASFSTISRDSSGLTVTSVSISGLDIGAIYYWRVSASNAGGTGSWSSVWSFTTVVGVPAAPILAAPASGTTGVALPASLVWNSSAGAVTYRLQVSTDSLFATTDFDSSGFTVTSKDVSGLLHGTKYFWRVDATNDGGAGPWSSVWSFITVVAVPAAPILAAPASGTTGVALPASLVWNSSAGAVTYRLQVSTDSLFATTDFDSSGFTVTSKDVSGLLHGTKYFWRVDATNDGGAGPWSSVWSFITVVAAPAAPTSLSATATGVSRILLGWTDNSTNETGFKVQRTLDTSSAWAEIVTLALNSEAYPDTGLIDGTNYFYRAFAFNAGGNSGFTNIANAATAMRPPGGLTASQAGAKVVLSWHDSSSSEEGYRVERKTGAGGTYAQIDSVGENVETYADSTVVGEQTYFYRVRGHNAVVVSSYSNEVNLTVTAVASDRPLVPDKYAISQNYPNPFNPSTVIEYAIPSSGFVELNVYDVTGQLVRTLVRQHQSTGYYSIRFEGSGLPSGVYFIRISVNSFTEIKKAVLMK